MATTSNVLGAAVGSGGTSIIDPGTVDRTLARWDDSSSKWVEIGSDLLFGTDGQLKLCNSTDQTVVVGCTSSVSTTANRVVVFGQDITIADAAEDFVVLGNNIITDRAGSGVASVVIGESLNVTNCGNSIVIGRAIAKDGLDNVVILGGSPILGAFVDDSVIIGRVDSSSNKCVIVGRVARGGGSNATACGWGARAWVARSSAFGSDCDASHNNSTALGYRSETTAANQVRIGASDQITALNVVGTITGESTEESSSTTTGAIQSKGGIAAVGNGYFGGRVTAEGDMVCGDDFVVEDEFRFGNATGERSMEWRRAVAPGGDLISTSTDGVDTFARTSSASVGGGGRGGDFNLTMGSGDGAGRDGIFSITGDMSISGTTALATITGTSLTTTGNVSVGSKLLVDSVNTESVLLTDTVTATDGEQEYFRVYKDSTTYATKTFNAVEVGNYIFSKLSAGGYPKAQLFGDSAGLNDGIFNVADADGNKICQFGGSALNLLNSTGTSGVDYALNFRTGNAPRGNSIGVTTTAQIRPSDGKACFGDVVDASYQLKVVGATYLDGKLTVTGLIDPTGLELTPQASNPGGTAANTLYVDSSHGGFQLDNSIKINGDSNVCIDCSNFTNVAGGNVPLLKINNLSNNYPSGICVVNPGTDTIFFNIVAPTGNTTIFGGGADGDLDRRVRITSGGDFYVGDGTVATTRWFTRLGNNSAGLQNHTFTFNYDENATSTSTGTVRITGGLSTTQDAYLGGDITTDGMATFKDRLAVTAGGSSDPGSNPGIFGDTTAAFVDDLNGITGIFMQNENSGASADYRFVLYEDGDVTTGAHYLAFSMPGTGNTNTLFGRTRSEIGSLFLNTLPRPAGSRALCLGTIGADDVVIGVSGNVGYSGLTIDGSTANVSLSSTTTSTSSSNGALVVPGGIGCDTLAIATRILTDSTKIRIGDGSVDCGNNSTVIGYGASASTSYESTTVIGHNCTASQRRSVVIGASSSSTNLESVVIGYNAHVYGNYSSAIGFECLANTHSAYALGVAAKAYSIGSLAIGADAQVLLSTSNSAIAIGNLTYAGKNSAGTDVAAYRSIAMGYDCRVAGEYSITIGQISRNDYDKSVVIGYGASSTADNQMMVGSSTNTLDLYSHGGAIFNGDVEVDSTSYFYLGDSSTDGSWRIGRSGNNLVIQRRESGTWNNKQEILA